MASVVSSVPLMQSTPGFGRFNDLFESMIAATEERIDTEPP